MPPATRQKASRPSAGSLSAAPEEPATIEVEIVPGRTKTYPDVADRWAEHVRETTALGSPVEIPGLWTAIRDAQTAFMRSRTVSEIRSWVHLDREPEDLVYLVEFRPSSRSRNQSKYTIIGAARRASAGNMPQGAPDGPEAPDTEGGEA